MAGHACAVAGGLGCNIDPKTYRKYVWQFIYAIADAESIMVSCLLQILQMLLLVKISAQQWALSGRCISRRGNFSLMSLIVA